MTMRALLGAMFTLFLGACTIDIGDGSQLAGQRCFTENDCSVGLTCSERVCVPSFGDRRMTDTGNNLNNNPDMTRPDGGPRPDMGPIDGGGPDVRPPCAPGERRCASASIVQECLPGGEVIEEICPDNAVCDQGDCVPVGPDCRDRDGDGYGPGCPRGFDCDDSNPRVNPGVPEFCATSADDNCNGQANEGCDPNGCCAAGCGPDEFCSQSVCGCQPFDPGICQYQNQPCAFEGDFENGFYCIAFSPNEQPRCWGICDISAPDPDQTCPEPGSICAFDGGDGQNGICMSPCTTRPDGTNTCSDPGLGCLNVDVGQGDGICVPTNPANGRGDRCDPDYFFDCADGLICLDGNGNGNGNRGRCREACRPFFWSGMGTDCDQGHCLAFSSDLGVCFQDNNATQGERCAPAQSACNADAVGCYDAGGGQECLRLCRQDQGDLDCFGAGAQTCTAFDPDQTELGICF